MRIKVTAKNSTLYPITYVRIESVIYMYGDRNGTTLVFDAQHSLYVKETIEEISSMLPGGIHEH